MDISIVIPALNEAQKIRFDVEAAASFIDENKFSGEVIVVDDGSTDGTADVAWKANVSSSVGFEVISLDQNSGKGFAVRAGILKARGDVVLFADSGTCIPYTNALKQIERIRAGDLDIAMASRRLKNTRILVDRSRKRRVGIPSSPGSSRLGPISRSSCCGSAVRRSVRRWSPRLCVDCR